MGITLRSAVMGAFLTFSGVLAAAATPPDFTGIWTSNLKGTGGPSLSNVKLGGGELTPMARQKLDEYRKLVAPTGDTPSGHCVMAGVPSALLLGGGYPMEFVQRPEQIWILYEGHSEIRRVYLSGPKVDPADLIPGRDGYSTGRFEGDTLIVETIGLSESIDADMPHSGDAKVIERYSLSTEGGRRFLSADLTIVDPTFYTRPATAKFKWAQLTEGRMMQYDCTEPNWTDYLDELRKKAAK